MKNWPFLIIFCAALAQAANPMTRKEYETLAFEGCMQASENNRNTIALTHCYCISQFTIGKVSDSEFNSGSQARLSEATSRELKNNLSNINACKDKFTKILDVKDARTLITLGYAEGYKRNLFKQGMDTSAAVLAANCVAEQITPQISDEEIIKNRGKPSDSLYASLIAKNKGKLIACEANAQVRAKQLK